MKTKKMTINGNGTIKISDEEQTKRLRELLRQAVNKEKAPENLREKIRKMIRES